MLALLPTQWIFPMYNVYFPLARIFDNHTHTHKHHFIFFRSFSSYSTLFQVFQFSVSSICHLYPYVFLSDAAQRHHIKRSVWRSYASHFKHKWHLNFIFIPLIAGILVFGSSDILFEELLRGEYYLKKCCSVAVGNN